MRLINGCGILASAVRGLIIPLILIMKVSNTPWLYQIYRRTMMNSFANKNNIKTCLKEMRYSPMKKVSLVTLVLFTLFGVNEIYSSEWRDNTKEVEDIVKKNDYVASEFLSALYIDHSVENAFKLFCPKNAETTSIESILEMISFDEDKQITEIESISISLEEMHYYKSENVTMVIARYSGSNERSGTPEGTLFLNISNDCIVGFLPDAFLEKQRSEFMRGFKNNT